MKQYKNDAITVNWEPAKCIHSENCWRGLPGVFNPKSKPWIQVDGATADELSKQIDACPSGALSYVKIETSDKASEYTEVVVSADGPLVFSTPIQLKDGKRSIDQAFEKVALCRCGASSNKPFCDGSHQESNFDK
ncbi:MAG: putative Fe-S cluster protein YjdI [Cyclobacteriaceae bacterium]|jgi:uncharacterized Fe-S cluster protein YjdI